MSIVEKFTVEFVEYMRKNANLFLESVFVAPCQVGIGMGYHAI